MVYSGVRGSLTSGTYVSRGFPKHDSLEKGGHKGRAPASLCPPPHCHVPNGQDSNQMQRTGSPEPTLCHILSWVDSSGPLLSQVWLWYPEIHKMTVGGTEA